MYRERRKDVKGECSEEEKRKVMSANWIGKKKREQNDGAYKRLGFTCWLSDLSLQLYIS